MKSMYPVEITSTPVWIRHKLPTYPPLRPNEDIELRRSIASQNVGLSADMIEHYVRQERARLDLKWCLDEFFYFTVDKPALGQIVVANVFGTAYLSYIIEIHSTRVMVLPADNLEKPFLVTYDDIYRAENSPFYDKFSLNQRLFHRQHVLDYVLNSKITAQLEQADVILPTSGTLSFDQHVDNYIDTEWPEGDETWDFAEEISQYDELVLYGGKLLSNSLISNVMEYSRLQLASSIECDASTLVSHTREQHTLSDQNSIEENEISQSYMMSQYKSIQKVATDKFIGTVDTFHRFNLFHRVSLPCLLSVLVNINLIICLFMSMIFTSYITHLVSSAINNHSFINKFLSLHKNDFECFRVLTVP